MKWVWIPLLFLNFNVSAQIDFPEDLVQSSDILHFLWSKEKPYSGEVLSYLALRNNINKDELSQLERFKLHLLDVEHELIQDQVYLTSEQLDLETLRFISIHPKLVKKIQLSRVDFLRYATVLKEMELVDKDWSLSSADLKDIFEHEVNYSSYQNGTYDHKVRLFLLCRKNRSYACLFVIKGVFGNFVRNENGDIWSLPALAKSKRGISYNKTNGNTPAGVHTMDAVMPEANRPLAFGKYRRVILNWVKNDSQGNEVLVKDFLPASQFERHWWRRASIARDVGRKYLRIHGTGKINSDPNSSFYPHIPTSGCISTREGKYPGVVYEDQNIILNKILEASQLRPVYSNHPKIKGLLYVLDIDDKKKAVTLNDLSSRGVF